MEFRKETKQHGFSVRISACENGTEIGAVYLYLIRNDSRKEPYALLEDLKVEEMHRRKGVGSALVKEAIAEARRLGCYKIIGTSRFPREHVHRFYERLGLKKHGYEFRLDL